VSPIRIGFSAMPNPNRSKSAHHWFDSTHVSFGVIKPRASIGGRRKIESSGVNGPRTGRNGARNLDLGPLDSVAGRAWLLPTPRLALAGLGGASAGSGSE